MGERKLEGKKVAILAADMFERIEIGRASCRERV